MNSATVEANSPSIINSLPHQKLSEKVTQKNPNQAGELRNRLLNMILENEQQRRADVVPCQSTFEIH